jgi:DNA-binding transcriptional LysR family regulator
MNIRHLQCFAAIANTNNYTKASERLFVSRQALSRTIRQLEQEIGKQLLVTVDNHTRLTAAGKEFLEEMVPVLADFERLEDRYSPAGRQTLDIVLAQGALHPMPTDYLDVFLKDYPNLTLSIEETSSDGVLEMVSTSEVEIGLLGTHPQYIQDYDYVDLAHPGYFITVPKDHPLVSYEILELTDLAAQHFVTLGKRNHLHRLFMEQCREFDISPDILAATSEMSLFNRYRIEGSALSFACAPMSVQPYGDVEYIPLNMKDSEVFGTYAIRRKDTYLSLSARRFWEYLESHRVQEPHPCLF